MISHRCLCNRTEDPETRLAFLALLKSCAERKDLCKGIALHAELLNLGFLHRRPCLANTLISMYAKCGVLAKAQQLHDELNVRDVVTWNALISGYRQQGKGYDAVNCYQRMQNEGLSPSAVTLTCILTSCGSIGAIRKGTQIHNHILTTEFWARVHEELPVRNVVSWNSLISGYVEEDRGHEAIHCFKRMQALIAGHVQHGLGAEALNCYEKMQREGLSPDAVTFSYVLKACGSTGAINKGRKIHKEIANKGLLKGNLVLGSALVDMYAKCGALEKAQELLEELPTRNVVSWSALIAGYAEHGQGYGALKCFERMRSEGICPDAVSFHSLLNACGRSGLFDMAQTYFANMSKNYGITPNLDHLILMLLVSGCAGNFDRAMSIIQTMPSSGETPIWCALLCTCRKWGNVQLGKWAFDIMCLM